jgi:hypothetical protein
VAVEVARLVASLSADTRQFDRSMDSSEKTMHKVGAGISKAARVASLAIVGGLGVAARVGWDEYKQGQLVAAQTNAVIQSTGGIANVSAKALDTLATSMMKKTGIDDEAIKSGANVLLTFTNLRNEAGKGNDIFNQSTRILADMSTALGTDMNKSAIQSGKSLNDPIKGVSALSRVGVTFTEAQKKSIKAMVEHGNAAGAQKLILKELNKEFGGSAEAAGKTLPGQINILKESFSNFMGEVVAKVIPRLVALIGFFREHTTIAKLLGGVIAGTVGILLAAAAAMKVYGAITAVTTAFKWLFVTSVNAETGAVIRASFASKLAAGAAKVWAAAQWLLNAALLANPIVLIVAGLVALGVALVLAWQKSETFRDIIIGTWEAIKGAAEAVWDFITDKIGGAIDFMVNLVQKHPLVWLITHMGEVRDAIENGVNAIVGFFTGLPGRILSGIQALASGAWSWLKSQFEIVVNFYSEKIGDIVGFFRDLPGRIAHWIETSLANLFGEDGIFRRVFRQAVNWVEGKVGDIVGFFRDLPGRISGWIETNLAALFGEDGAFRKVFRQAVTWVEGKLGDIVGFFRDLPGRLGKAVLEKAGDLKDAIVDLLKKALPSWVEDALGISSPSKVFERIGGAIVDGIIVGIRNKMGDLRDTAIGLATRALGAVEGAARGALGGGGLGDIANLVTLGQRLQAAGFQVGEHPAFGGVSPVHTATSWHYKGRAIDVNWPGGGPLELARLTQIYNGLRGDRRILEMMIEDIGKANQHLHIAMAKGGLFTKPWTGLVSVAEQGKPEGFFPLDRLGGVVSPARLAPGGRGGGDVHVHLTNRGVLGSEIEVMNWLRNAFMRSQGRGDSMPWDYGPPGFGG